MTNVTRRQLLLGGSALAAASLIPGIPKTPLTPEMRFMRDALSLEIPRPDYMIRLSSNENPYGPSRVALQAIAANVHVTNRYANSWDYLTELMAELNGVEPEMVMVGTGSSEILNVAGMIAGMAGGSIVCADPTYQSLLRYAENAGSEIIRVPVNEALSADLDAMRLALRDDTNMVYLVNPNNPIPSVIEKNAMREFVTEMSQTRLVFVDEAYHEYVDDPDYSSMIDLVAAGNRNLIVSRTASKIHGLAGLRVGFGFAHPELIREMEQRATGRTNILGLKAAYASYQDEEFQRFTLRKNTEAKAIVANMCEELGLRHIRSNTNFTFIETGMENKVFQARMREHGILTGRDFPPYHQTWSRVSMSKPEEMEYFVQVYRRLFA